MKNDLEQFKALMGDPIKQLEDIVASLKLERDKLEAKPQPKPQVPTTIEAVYSEVRPMWHAAGSCGVAMIDSMPQNMSFVPTHTNTVQILAFAQLLTLVACLDSHFGEEYGYAYAIDRDYDVYCWEFDDCNKPLITFKTEQAAEHAKTYFLPLFEQYYGVSE